MITHNSLKYGKGKIYLAFICRSVKQLKATGKTQVFHDYQMLEVLHQLRENKELDLKVEDDGFIFTIVDQNRVLVEKKTPQAVKKTSIEEKMEKYKMEQEIVELYKNTKLTQKEIGKRYNLRATQVQYIVSKYCSKD